MPPLFGLAPGGVYRAATVAGHAVRFYRTLSTLRPKAGGMLSVALSLSHLCPRAKQPAGRYPAPLFRGAGLSCLTEVSRGRPSPGRPTYGLLRPRQQECEQLGPAFSVDDPIDEVRTEAALEGDHRLLPDRSLHIRTARAPAGSRRRSIGVHRVAGRARQRQRRLASADQGNSSPGYSLRAGATSR